MTETAFNIGGVSVMLAMPVHRDMDWEVVKSLVETQTVLHDKGIPFEIQFQVGNSIVTHARTKIVHSFMKSECNRLFWIDSDIAWKPEDFMRLLVLSTKMDVIGGIYTAKKEPPVFYINLDGCEGVLSNEYGCVKVGGLGLGFTIVNRAVIEKLYDKSPTAGFHDVEGGPVPQVFRCDVHNGLARGEDMAFFADIIDLGYDVYLDPTIVLKHVGRKAYSSSFMALLKDESQAAGQSAY